MKSVWAELNERQQQFLLALYRCECDAAYYYLSTSAIFDSRRKAGEWRWIEHGVTVRPPKAPSIIEDFKPGRRELGQRLRSLGFDDQGIGSTFKSLAGRGLLETRDTVFETPYGNGVLLWARLTRQGRACVKSHSTARPPERKTPEQTAEEKRRRREAFERDVAERKQELDLLTRGRELSEPIKRLVWAEWTLFLHHKPRDPAATREVVNHLRDLYSQLERANLFPDHLPPFRLNPNPPEYPAASDEEKRERRRWHWVGLLMKVRTADFIYDLLYPS